MLKGFLQEFRTYFWKKFPFPFQELPCTNCLVWPSFIRCQFPFAPGYFLGVFYNLSYPDGSFKFTFKSCGLLLIPYKRGPLIKSSLKQKSV